VELVRVMGLMSSVKMSGACRRVSPSVKFQPSLQVSIACHTRPGSHHKLGEGSENERGGGAQSFVLEGIPPPPPPTPGVMFFILLLFLSGLCPGDLCKITSSKISSDVR
jgi:hypothetical protein